GCTASSSNLSMAPAFLSLVLVGAKRLRQQPRFQARRFGHRGRVVELRPVFARDLPLDGFALRLGGKGHFVRRDVEVPIGAGDRDHWHASQSGVSTAQNLASPAADCPWMPPAVGTALSCPALEVDFSAWVAPMARR